MTDNQTMSSAVASQRRGKGALITGAVLLVLGVALVVVGIVRTDDTAKALADIQIGSSQTTPATFTSELDSFTTYAVYEQSDAGSGTVSATDITVTNSKGDPTTVNETTDDSATTGDGGKRFVAVANFTTGTASTFTIEVATDGAVVAVAPSASTVSKGFVGTAGVVIGLLVGLLGIILLILGAARRASSRG